MQAAKLIEGIDADSLVADKGQDCGSWTLLNSTPLQRRQAAWLYAQFTACKSVSLKKTLVGLTPIRDSDVRSAAMSEAAPRLGGLVEFYRSLARVAWTPRLTCRIICCSPNYGGRALAKQCGIRRRLSR